MSLSARESEVIGSVSTELFIGGQWRPATGGATVPVDDPATGEVIAHIADASVADGTAALHLAGTLALTGLGIWLGATLLVAARGRFS